MTVALAVTEMGSTFYFRLSRKLQPFLFLLSIERPWDSFKVVNISLVLLQMSYPKLVYFFNRPLPDRGLPLQ